MDKATFMDHLADTAPDKKMNPFLRALWYDRNGDWAQAHEIVQQISGEEAARIHAYLHRKEGDAGNAGYWYARANVAQPDVSLEQEWKSLLNEYLTIPQ